MQSETKYSKLEVTHFKVVLFTNHSQLIGAPKLPIILHQNILLFISSIEFQSFGPQNKKNKGYSIISKTYFHKKKKKKTYKQIMEFK